MSIECHIFKFNNCLSQLGVSIHSSTEKGTHRKKQSPDGISSRQGVKRIEESDNTANTKNEWYSNRFGTKREEERPRLKLRSD